MYCEGMLKKAAGRVPNFLDWSIGIFLKAYIFKAQRLINFIKSVV